MDTWKNVSTNTADFKELIPEFYQPECKGDFLVNSLVIYLCLKYPTTTLVYEINLPLLHAFSEPQIWFKI